MSPRGNWEFNIGFRATVYALHELREALDGRKERMDDRIPIRLDVNQDERTMIIRIPWEQLSGQSLLVFQIWAEQVTQVCAQWKARGYQCTSPLVFTAA